MTFSKTDFLILELMPYLNYAADKKESKLSTGSTIEEEYFRLGLRGRGPADQAPRRDYPFRSKRVVVRRRIRQAKAERS